MIDIKGYLVDLLKTFREKLDLRYANVEDLTDIDTALTEVRTDYVKKVLAAKSYTDIIGTANNIDGARFFFGTVVPTEWTSLWHIKYRIYAHMQGRSTNDGDEWSEVELCGSASLLHWTKSYNAIRNTGYRPYYYHYCFRLTESGFNAGYGHLIGVGMNSSYSPTNASYKRNFTIEVLETDNCTFTFMDNMALYLDIPGQGTTNYTAASTVDASTSGVTVTGDRNTHTIHQIVGECWITAGTGGILGYTIIMADSTGTYQSIVLSNSTGTNKSKNSIGFDLTKPIYWYYASANITEGNHTTASVTISYAGDMRYSCNCGSTLVKGNPFYLVMTKGNDDLFYLDNTWWTQTLPSTNDGKYYIYIGRAYNSYSVQMEIERPIYFHDGTKIVRYIARLYNENGENTSNKVTSLSSSSTDTQYPSAKCVYDLVGNVETLLSNI